MVQRALIEKMELEVAMLGAPDDESLRDAYFDTLTRFAAVRTGLCHAILPELGHPVYFRCGTHDVANLAHVFRHDAYGGAMRSSPLHLLDLGAYAGYAAIYLARRFPRARILCVEPCASNARVLLLNTAPYSRISRIAAAAWRDTCPLEVASRRHGDWGTTLRERPSEPNGALRGMTVAELLLHAGWPHVDMVKCDIQGAEAGLFADRHAPWLRTLDALMIRIHDGMGSPTDAAVTACFDPDLFFRSQYGETLLFDRRVPFRPASRQGARGFALLHDEVGLYPLGLRNLPQPDGFFIFDNHSCLIQPGPVGGPAAQLVFPRTLNGQTWFNSGIERDGEGDGRLTFAVEIRREDDSLVGSAHREVGPGAGPQLSLALPPLVGRHRIVLSVTSDAATGPSVRGRWINPRMS